MTDPVVNEARSCRWGSRGMPTFSQAVSHSCSHVLLTDPRGVNKNNESLAMLAMKLDLNFI